MRYDARMLINETTDRIAAIIASHDDDPDMTIALAYRELLITLMHDETINLAEFAHLDQSQRRDLLELRDLLRSLIDYEFARDTLTTMLLDESLCPLHAIDFAICFDDDDPTCAQIRAIYPYSHDT